jgi:SulP family sulfate permease
MVINLDTTCLDALETLRRSLEKRGAVLVLCDVNEQPLSLMRRSGFLWKLEEKNLLPDFTAAVGRAREFPAG